MGAIVGHGYGSGTGMDTFNLCSHSLQKIKSNQWVNPAGPAHGPSWGMPCLGMPKAALATAFYSFFFLQQRLFS
jgi:hypothetical protein